MSSRKFFDSDESYQNYLIQEKISALYLIATELGVGDYSTAFERITKELQEIKDKRKDLEESEG